ncbi:GNAT family N-acetyltransferase [Paraferrimonas haliotis]|uniref:N-acetyltransferase n=1 Tax=Paraferrimonas haliotis TaxID=2013866 RepID=A0AA37WXH1_9GAMM|nr:GNAT family protein [Paraferrimonas haliotis]GLS84558.1 N-acetyltransferase [Paraferrimonas haliotis]
MHAIKLTSTHCIIRPFQLKDLECFAEYRGQESVARYQSWSNYSYQDAVKLFEAMDYSTFGSIGQWYQLAIVAKKGDSLLGDLAIHFVDEQQLEIGFTVAPQFQGQGIASEAVSALLAYVFTHLKIHRVTATTDVNNVASYKLLEKLKFRREAHFIQNIFFKGKWGDEYQYALLRSESVSRK